MIKNIIFDFGGVIYDIDHERTKKAFANLGIHDFEQLYGHHIQTKLFEQLERGEIKEQQFYHILRQSLKQNISNEQIKDAWNAMLIGFDTRKIDLLKGLKNNYQLFLLSNTNSIHQKYFLKDLSSYVDFNSLFCDSWYSHEQNMRKPESRIYQTLLKKHELIAQETLFIDDLDTNIEAAQALGLQSYYLKNQESILSLFKGYIFNKTL